MERFFVQNINPDKLQRMLPNHYIKKNDDLGKTAETFFAPKNVLKNIGFNSVTRLDIFGLKYITK